VPRWLPLALLIAAALALALFHGSALDLAATRFFFDPATGSFPLKDSHALAVWGHTVVKWLALGAWLACVVEGGPWRRGAIYALVIAAVVALLKQASPWSCPWDLPAFGGSRPETGGCLPAGHPLSGFAFFGVAAALWTARRHAAWMVLALASFAGIAAGAVQVARGAHFVSHVLATAWCAAALAVAFKERAITSGWDRTG
jgi:membrane-associated PAP2 superfamily phosphatase